MPTKEEVAASLAPLFAAQLRRLEEEERLERERPLTLAVGAAEAAELLGISRWTIHRLVAAGDLAKLPHLGKRVLIARAELERFVAQGVGISTNRSLEEVQ